MTEDGWQMTEDEWQMTGKVWWLFRVLEFGTGEQLQ